MKVIRLYGIDIKINILLGIIFGVFFIFGYIENTLISFIVVLLHEGAHIIAANSLGYKISSIEIFPFGGIARTQENISIHPTHEIFIAIVGPIFNLILSFAGSYILRRYYLSNELFIFFVYTNLIIGIFNLLPIIPLDGGRIIRAYFVHLIGYKKATKITVVISKMMNVFLFIWGCYMIQYNKLNSFILLLSIFLYIAAHRELKIANYVFIKEIAHKSRQFKYRGVLDTKHITVLENTSVKDVINEFVPRKYHIIIVVDGCCNVLGSLTEKELIDGSIKYGINVPLEKLLIGK